MMPGTFEAFDVGMQSVLESMFGADPGDGDGVLIYTPYIARPSASPVRDPDRSMRELPAAIVSLSHGRVNIGDNGLGRASGRFNLASTINVVTIAFGKLHLPYRPTRFDQVSIGADDWSVAEVMDDGGAAWALRLNRI